MALPKIEHPIFDILIPSTKKNFKFRPFLVKEEKILLMAKTGADASGILAAIKQIVNNCCVEENFNVDKLAIFDLEYVFLKLRANSVGNVIKVSFKDNEDNRDYPFEVDLGNVNIVYPKNVSNQIVIDESIGLIMKYPDASLYDDKDFLNLGEEVLFELIVRCVDKIYQADQMFDPKNYSKEELSDFIDSLGVKAFEQIQAFLNDAPSMIYTITYKNSLGNERKIELKTLSDFFTLR